MTASISVASVSEQMAEMMRENVAKITELNCYADWKMSWKVADYGQLLDDLTYVLQYGDYEVYEHFQNEYDYLLSLVSDVDEMAVQNSQQTHAINAVFHMMKSMLDEVHFFDTE
jgi:hypothetical protein